MSTDELLATMRREARRRARATIMGGLDPSRQERRLMHRYPSIASEARAEYMLQHEIAAHELGKYVRRANDN